MLLCDNCQRQNHRAKSIHVGVGSPPQFRKIDLCEQCENKLRSEVFKVADEFAKGLPQQPLSEPSSSSSSPSKPEEKPKPKEQQK